jgi:branched-chain amino acid transport system permease protein
LSHFLQTTLDWLTVGGLYALIALGYTLVYGILRFINFAHSDVVAWGGWIAFAVAGAAGLLARDGAPIIAVVLVIFAAMALCAALGVTIERLAYRPLRAAPRLNVLITAIGVSLFLQNVGLKLFGNRPRSMSAGDALIRSQELAKIGDVPIQLFAVLTIVLALVLVVALQWLVYRTKMGRAMRAVAFDERIAALMGVNVNRVVTLTFALGSALAAVGGILAALRNDLQMTAEATWVVLGLKAFVAAVVGGIGNVRGAAAGAMLIAFVEQFLHAYIVELFPGTRWVQQLQDIYVFGILILVLLFRPGGLLGGAVVEKV